MSKDLRFDHVGPQFKVKDVGDAVAFYSTALHFEVDYFTGDPPTYAVVSRDNVYLHLFSAGELAEKTGPGVAFVVVQGIAELWEVVEEFADIDMVYPLKDRDYGEGVRFTDFAIADPDGNVLRIGEQLDEAVEMIRNED